MKQIREKNNALFIDKFICLCNGLDIVETQRVKEDLPYGMSVEKEICTFEENDDFNLSEERMNIKHYENCNIYTNEDLFVLALSPKTNIYLYSEDDDLFVVDNLDIVGQHTYISETEICSTNLVSPSFSMEHKNFSYFKDFVMKNRTEIEGFEIVYKDNDFQINVKPSVYTHTSLSSDDMPVDMPDYMMEEMEAEEPAAEEIKSDEPQEAENILRIRNVSKKMIYPFVLYILSKIRTDDDFMENYKVVAGELIR